MKNVFTKMEQWIIANWTGNAIETFVELEIHKILLKKPLSIVELAEQTGTHEDSLRRLLNVTSAIGITEANDGMYSLSSADMVPVLGVFFSRMVNILRELSYSIKTGEPVFGHLYGMSFWVKI